MILIASILLIACLFVRRHYASSRRFAAGLLMSILIATFIAAAACFSPLSPPLRHGFVALPAIFFIYATPATLSPFFRRLMPPPFITLILMAI